MPSDIQTLVPVALDERGRIEMTVSCRDCETIPKVAGAGEIVERNGRRVQIMHNGVVVLADGYCGTWMTEIIRRLRGHHEPQEERVFASILSIMGDDATMIEVGGYWSYYSLWFLRGFPKRKATVIEPDPAHMAVGKTNASLNDATISFIRAFAAREDAAWAPFATEQSGELLTPAINVGALIDREFGMVDILHCDAQGAELALLESCADAFTEGKARFAIVSTHACQITGDYLTHQRCLEKVKAMGGQVLAEHDVHESFSGDGLIAVYFGRDPDLLGATTTKL